MISCAFDRNSPSFTKQTYSYDSYHCLVRMRFDILANGNAMQLRIKVADGSKYRRSAFDRRSVKQELNQSGVPLTGSMLSSRESSNPSTLSHSSKRSSHAFRL